jgi:glycosyltransferase involved in cell wall biosynthesis
MRPPKIAVVAFSAPPNSAGGVAAAHFNLFRALQEEGNQARLFTFGEPDLENGADIVRSGTPAWLVKFLLKINGRVFGLLQPGKRAYETADIFTSLVGAHRMSRAISEFGPDVIILSDHGAPGLMMKKPKGSRIILVSHHNPARFVAHPELADFSRLDASWALRLEQRVLRRIDAVVCPSKYMKDWFQRSYRFLGPIRVIPNLLNQELLDRIAEVDIREQLSLKPNARDHSWDLG